VHIEDACAFIGRADREYDMILLDTYCGIELAETVDNRSFFENCAALLSGAGILAVNLIPRRAGHMEERLSWFRHALGHVYLMRGITRTNEVAYARKNPIDKITLAKNLISIKKKLPANLKAKQMLKRLEDRSH
jgi:spermidine synthase